MNRNQFDTKRVLTYVVFGWRRRSSNYMKAAKSIQRESSKDLLAAGKL